MSLALPHYYQRFRSIVEQIFNKWTGLRLAVEQGMGGPTGFQTALQMIDYVSQFCCNDDISEKDITNCLDDILEEEFDTTCEDNSTTEIGFVLKRYKSLCQQDKYAEIETEISQLPSSGPLWLSQTPRIVYKRRSTSDEEDSHMEQDETPPIPSTSGSTTIMEKEESEWVAVKSRKKRY